MQRFFGLITLVLLAVLAGGCSDSKTGSPRTNEAHPDGWQTLHARDALALNSPERCQICHGSDFRGGSVGVGCFDCHLAGPPFTIHPEGWTNVVLDHQGFASNSSWTSCATAVCHGPFLRGGTAGPSCFNQTSGCHSATQGNPPAPHILPYTNPADHGMEAKTRQLYCLNCHGRPLNSFDGGFVADPQILNDSVGNCSSCHSAAMAHPANWQGSNDLGVGSDAQDNAYASSHRGLNTPGCALCHRTTQAGPGPFAGAPSCFDGAHLNANGITTGCHALGPGVAHLMGANWLLPSGTVQTSHVLASIAGTPECTNCHAQSGGLVLPDCGTCHAAKAPNNIVGTCDSCHNAPPDGLAPAGNSRPNRAGAHLGHDGLTTRTTDCSACHSGAGTDTTGHYDSAAPANLTFAGLYNGKAGSAAYTSGDGTCSNVSCHGGQPTPAWLTGGMVVTQDCTLCHALGTAPLLPENNSYYSGRHNSHAEPGGRADGLGFSPTCSACHDSAALAGQHFSGLDTAAFEGSPAATLRGDLGYNSAVTPPTCTTGITGCHSGATRDWSATGGAPHAFGPAYLAPEEHGRDAKGLNPTVFPNGLIDCQGCHGQAGGAGSNPRFNIGIASAGNKGCEGCHNDGTAHPAGVSIMLAPRELVKWYDVNFTHNDVPIKVLNESCALCHTVAWWGVGPHCAGTCHVADPRNYTTGCLSCHNLPPDGLAPADNSHPNRNGAHTVHRLLTAVGTTCSNCHDGAGYGTAAHFDEVTPADVVVMNNPSQWKAQAGGDTSFTSGACSNVSCHGGQLTPDWLTGSLSSLTGNALCLSCHAAGTGQYNGYSSGMHPLHLGGLGILCTECHDPDRLTNAAAIHFNDLGTPAMTEARLTIALNPAIGTPGTYTPGAASGSGSCTVSCHGWDHSSVSW